MNPVVAVNSLFAGQNYPSYLQLPLANAMNNELAEGLKSSIRVYPNPSNGQVYLAGLPAGGWIRLFDLTGQEVYASELAGRPDQLGLDLSGLMTGIYLLQVEEDGALVFQQKLLLK